MRIPLHEAILLRREHMVRLFLKVMPSLVNVCDRYGWSPAHYALNVNSWRLLTILLNVREPLTNETVSDLEEACKREIEQGGRTSRFVAKQIQQQMEGIRVGLWNESRLMMTVFE